MKTEKPLKIGVDLRPLLGGKISGVETYIKNILKHILAQDDFNQYYFWANTAKGFDFPKYLKKKNTHFVLTRKSNKLLNLSTRYFGYPYYEKFFPEKLDLFWVTDPRPVNFKNTPVVSTFHDLSPEIFPEFFNRKTKVWHKLVQAENLVKKSRGIIAVSENTKEDLMEIYGIDSEKIKVIYEAADESLKPAKKAEVEVVRKKYNLPERYILTLSTLEPRKNLLSLIEAFRAVKAMIDCPHKLVVAGISNDSIFAKMPELKNEKDIIFTGFVDEEDKAALYTGSDFFVYVSLLEGFGLPVAEALACGKACVVANNSSLTEVAGDAGLQVDPFRISSIVEGLHMVIKDHHLKKALEDKAKEQKKMFSWKKAARETLKYFYSVSSGM